MSQTDVRDIITSLIDTIEKMQRTMLNISVAFDNDFHGTLPLDYAVSYTDEWIDNLVVRDILTRAKCVHAQLVDVFVDKSPK